MTTKRRRSKRKTPATRIAEAQEKLANAISKPRPGLLGGFGGGPIEVVERTIDPAYAFAARVNAIGNALHVIELAEKERMPEVVGKLKNEIRELLGIPPLPVTVPES